MARAKRKTFASALSQLHRDLGVKRKRVTAHQRLLNETEPGNIILLGSKKQLKRTGKATFELRRQALAKGLDVETPKQKIQRRGVRNSFTISFGVSTEFGFDLDVRKLLREYIQIPLGLHFRNQLMAGMKPDGSGRVRAVSEKTKSFSPTHPGHWGNRSGWMAHNWLVFPINGNQFEANCILKPNGADFRNHVIRKALGRGVDFQSVKGSAARVIADGFDAWMQDIIAGRKGVATPKQVDTQKGVLSQMVGGPHQGSPPRE